MGQGQFQTDSEYAASQGLLDLDDLKSAKFGTGKDFRIWYTGGNARLVCADGDIQFRHATSYDTAEGGETFDPDNQDKMMHLNDDAGVECFYADSLKFETTSDGAKVTGTLEITGDFEPEKIVMKDDKKIEFGDGTDLIIEHDTASDPDCNLINSTDEILRFSSTHSTNNHPYGFSFDQHIRLPRDKRIEFAECDVAGLQNPSDVGLFIEHDTSADPDINIIDSSDHTLKFKSSNGTYGFDFDNHIRLPDDKRIELGGNQDLKIEHDTANDPDCNIIDSSNEFLKFKSSHGTYGFEFDNHIRIPDDKRIEFGNSQDFIIEYDGASDPDCGLIQVTDKPIALRSNHSNYGVEINNHVRLPDDKRIEFGNNQDLTIEHDTASDPDCNIIDSTNEYLKFKSTHGTYGFEFNNHVRLPDDKRIELGNSQDLTIEHDTASDPDCNIIDSTDEYLKFKSSHGTYGFSFDNHVRLPKDKRLELGDSQEFTLEYDESADPDQAEIKCASSRIKMQSNVAITLEETDGTNMIIAEKDGKSALYYAGDNKLETKSDGVKITGNLEITGDFEPDDIDLSDSGKIKLGTGEDLEIYHDGSNGYIKNTGDGNLFIAGHDDCHIYIRAKSGENSIICYDDAGVALYEDDELRFETVDGGCKVTGDLEVTDDIDLSDSGVITFGTGDDMHVYHDGSNGYIQLKGTGNLFIAGSHSDDPGGGDTHIYIRAKSGEDSIICYDDGGVSLYDDGSEKLTTASYGVKIHGDLNLDDNDKIELGNSQDFDIWFDGTDCMFHGTSGYFKFNRNLEPTSHRAYDLGDGSNEWDDVYCVDLDQSSDRKWKKDIVTSDLGLSFINKLNPVSYKRTDGTSGRTHYGFVAQEVEQALTDIGKTTKEFGGVTIDKENYFLRFSQFTAPLTKAVQELSAEVETLKAEIAALKSS